MGDKFIPKCITIPKEQNDFVVWEIDNHNFNFSRFVQEKVWEYMKEREERNEFIENSNRIIEREVNEYGKEKVE